MAKAFFRFLRGELNGYYITAINNTLNVTTENIKSFLHNFSKLTFKLPSEVEGEEVAFSESQIKGIGIFSGSFIPWLRQESVLGSIRFTPSHIVSGREYSERGLFNINTENFQYVRTDETEIDLNTVIVNDYATSMNRSSFIDETIPVIGYFEEGDNIILPDGSLDLTKLKATPDSNKAYSEYYGDRFLFLTENTEDYYNGSFQLTDSFIIDDKEFASMCLFDMLNSVFQVFNVDSKYLDDINTEATNTLRTSVVEAGARVLGYIKEGDEIIRNDGTLDMSKLLSSPPEDSDYSEWYGYKYLFLNEGILIKSNINIRVYYEVIKAMQWLRYNGCSITSLCKFIELLCPNYLFIVNIEWTSSYARGIVNYGIDTDYDTEDKLLRFEVFQLLINMKFPQYAFNEVPITVSRDSAGNVISVVASND